MWLFVIDAASFTLWVLATRRSAFAAFVAEHALRGLAGVVAVVAGVVALKAA